MDRVMFLNSSGGILQAFAPYRRSTSPLYTNEPLLTLVPLRAAPHVEQVTLPVVSVDSSAIYGDHPENLATVTYSSGAALTFFCDSEAGGTNTSGDGSFDNPWRSMKTASNFLECAACILRAAAPYVQLKVKGTVDYLSGAWGPFYYHDRFIVAGWGEKCDLGTAAGISARYLFDLRARPYGYSATCSGCTIPADAGTNGDAVDCELEGRATVNAAVNCSGAAAAGSLGAAVCRGGSFAHPVSANYIYDAEIDVKRISSGGYVSAYGLITSAAVDVSVTASGFGSSVKLTGIDTRPSSYLANCSVAVNASAYLSGGGSADAYASAWVLGGYAARTISGGVYSGAAVATAVGESRAEAYALVYGNYDSRDAVSGATFILSAHAGGTATDPGDFDVIESETITNNGSTCWELRARWHLSGSGSSYTSSGCY